MKTTIKRLLWIAIGQFLMATVFSRIFVANGLVATGLGGLAGVINQVTGLNVQILLILMALPLFIWAFFFYDKKQIFYAGFSFFIFTFYIGIVEKYIPPFETDMVVAVVSGGVLSGLAAGLVMKQKVANGPEAIISLYLKEKTGLTIGTFFLVLNSVIICSSIIYGDLTIIVYSFVANYIQSFMTDIVIIGGKKYYTVNVVSSHYLDIAQFIQTELKRSSIFISSIDTQNVSKKMLVQTVITRNELLNLSYFVESLDDNSFIYTSKTTSVLGRGFDL